MANAVGPEEDLLPSIRQLITSVAPSLHAAASVPAAEDVLYHLEETDENFHRYEFVKYVRNKMDEALGPLIEEKLEESGHYGGQSRGSEEALIQMITNHVISDPACIEMLQTLRIKTKDAVERLLAAYDSGRPQHQSLNYQAISSTYDRRVMHSYSMSDDGSSLDSSFNQSTFLFMNQEHFVGIAENLELGKPIDVRLEAMQSLLKIPPSDVVACEQWDTLRVSLLAALNDDNEILADKSLRFHARMFSSNSHSVMREVYLSLVHHLSSCFSSSKAKAAALEDGVDFADPRTENLLRKFRLMNEFQREAQSYWIRFPDRFLDEVTEVTFDLMATELSPSPGTHEPLTPLHYIAVIDPMAVWFKTWMHGDYSRRAVMQLVENNISLIEGAVGQCLSFISGMMEGNAMSALSRRLDRQKLDSADSRRSRYTEQEIQFLLFNHNLSLLGRLLCYKNGRALFPVQLADGTTVSASDFLMSLIRLITDHLEPSLPPGMDTTFLSNCSTDVVTDLIRTLCSVKSACSECLLKDSLVSEIMNPVKRWLRHGKVSSDCTMLHTADILSGIASWESGKRLLMYGEDGDHLTINESAPIHLIAEFCCQSLESPAESDLQVCPPRRVIGAYLLLCRQFYNNCEGLHVLHPYGIHHLVANAWLEASRETDQGATPTMENVNLGSPRSSEVSSHMWEQTLVENLLSMAGTPKGLLLLQQTGLMNEAVAYMCGRYAKKLQVSKTEKFGYGFMVTQIASTAPGMVALQNTGFVQTLIHELWSVLECGSDDHPCFGSSPQQALSVDDRPTQKCFIRLVNVLSSFPGVYELVAGQSLANKDTYSVREVPNTLPDLLDRIVMVNSDVKSHFLFNAEQTQVFGLRLLNVMSTSLDLWLLLETQYKLWDFLLDEQNANRNDESGEVMTDHLSVERHHILVRTNVVGGPSERALLRRTWLMVEDSRSPVYDCRMFSSFPVPKEYSIAVNRAATVKSDTELETFLESQQEDLSPQEWLRECQTAFCETIRKKPENIQVNVLGDLLQKVVHAQLKLPDEYQAFPMEPCSVTDPMLKGQKLSAIQMLGAKLTIRYGKHLKLLSGNSNVNESLSLLLRQCQHFLRGQQRNLNSEMLSLQGDYVGHDWFASTIFIMMSGDRDLAWSFLHSFSSLLPSAYLWIPRLHASIHLPVEQASSSIHPVFSTVCHNVELILQLELPQIFSAFRLSGFSPAQICQTWLYQCFWNYLDFPDICQYICLSLLMGADYQVYFCVSLLKHLQPEILVHTQQQRLQIFLKESSIEGFHVGDYIEFLRHLEKKYRSVVLEDMEALNKG